MAIIAVTVTIATVQSHPMGAPVCAIVVVGVAVALLASALTSGPRRSLAAAFQHLIPGFCGRRFERLPSKMKRRQLLLEFVLQYVLMLRLGTSIESRDPQ
jgi:hypothetical protein